MKKLLTNPVVHLILIFGGTLALIEFVHTKAHFHYEVDVHGYVKQYCAKNDCSQFVDDW